jgi:hypothetical protein
LQVLLWALNAKLRTVEKIKGEDGQLRVVVREIGPDHYARLTAVRLIKDFLLAGRATPKAIERPPAKPVVTMDHIRAFIAEHAPERLRLVDDTDD